MLDMWPFLGVNHYENFNKEARWVKGYSEVGRPENYRGIDLNKINSGKKKSSWNSRITFIAPGHWLRGQAQASSILKGKEVLVIPPALDTNKFTPSVDKKSNVRGNRFTIGYGGALATRKGWPLFQKFLNTFSGNLVDSKIITFGSEPSEEFNSPYYDVLQMGKNKSEDELKMIYQQLDVLIFPSTVEAYGLIAQEAQSCGVPVICISNTGAEDVIIPNVTGLAIVNTINALTEAIEIYKQNQDFLKSSSFRARLHAESSWSYDVVSKQIGSLYRQVLIQHKTRLD
jgi:glycosyltransferase involved in cell wall biosynthesis